MLRGLGRSASTEKSTPPSPPEHNLSDLAMMQILQQAQRRPEPSCSNGELWQRLWWSTQPGHLVGDLTGVIGAWWGRVRSRSTDRRIVVVGITRKGRGSPRGSRWNLCRTRAAVLPRIPDPRPDDRVGGQRQSTQRRLRHRTDGARSVTARSTPGRELDRRHPAAVLPDSTTPVDSRRSQVRGADATDHGAAVGVERRSTQISGSIFGCSRAGRRQISLSEPRRARHQTLGGGVGRGHHRGPDPAVGARRDVVRHAGQVHRQRRHGVRPFGPVSQYLESLRPIVSANTRADPSAVTVTPLAKYKPVERVW